MKGNIPIAGEDFIAVSNGYKFGIGINNPTGDEPILSLSIEKAPGAGTESPATWQHHLQDNDPVLKCVTNFKGDMIAYYRDFLARAFALFKQLTGGSVPDWPENDLDGQLKWMLKHGTAFSASGFTVTTPK